MRTDAIDAIGVEDDGSLWVKPATATFPYIYREAMEVHWDAKRMCLYAPKPRDWSYADWFEQIRKAARQQGIDLTVEETTSWSNIDTNLQHAMLALAMGDRSRHSKN
jgi:hypothetical protein